VSISNLSRESSGESKRLSGESLGQPNSPSSPQNGQIVYPNGDVYVGSILNGERSGRGKTTSPNGKVCHGIYMSDKLICDFSIKAAPAPISSSKPLNAESSFKVLTHHGILSVPI